MSQKSDDSIERFFRKAVVQQDKTFMERDWHSMEKMLDAHASTSAALQTARMRSVIKATAIAIVLTSLFLIGTETQTDPRNVQMQAAVGTVGPRIEVKTENPTADLHPFDLDCTGNGSAQNLAVETVRPTRGEKPDRVLGQTSLPAYLVQSLQDRHADDSIEKITSPQIANQETSMATSANEFKSADNLLASAYQPTVLSSGVEKKTASIDSANTDREIEIAAPREKEKENEPSLSRRPKVVVTGMVSPDFSTTSLTKYSKPSGVFGFLVGYKILKRVTVMTGVTKSLKKYEGYGSEYSPPEGYWQYRTNGVVPDEVEGKCGIIEVPLLVQYDLVQRSKSRIFLSTGVSSYFMRSENYQYTFNTPNPGAADSWTAREPSQYLFKIGHLSAGYDRMIGKNLSVGIEPFLKVPFEGIGWTDINLYTAGAYLNIRYTIFQN